MKKKIVIIGSCIIALVLIISILVFMDNKKVDNQVDYENDLVSNIENPPKFKEIIENTQIQGIVEIHHNGFIYLFKGQHFGEYGFEIEGYTSTHIDDKKQKCIDYILKKEYDTSYIQEGDLLICTGDLKKAVYGENNFDTKDNPIIVLKAEDYNKMKQEAIKEEREVVVTVGEYFDTATEIYLKYEISDKTYQLPFGLKCNMTENTKIIGKLEQGKKVKVQYKNKDVSLEELEIEKIEVVE